MTIKLFLSQTDSRPMYLQIMAQIKQKIAVGDWQPGFHLPSIRELAAVSGVSVITVKRSYSELESEGIIYTQQGKGSFVAQKKEIQSDLLLIELDEKLDEAISISQQLELDNEQVVARLKDKLESGT